MILYNIEHEHRLRLLYFKKTAAAVRPKCFIVIREKMRNANHSSIINLKKIRFNDIIERIAPWAKNLKNGSYKKKKTKKEKNQII